MMLYKLIPPSVVTATIQLPASKSISNRALIINALGKGIYPPENLSDCDDTQVMIKALTEGKETIDIMAAGTAMRFLTAYLSVTPGERTITGTARMQQRPIQILVNALRELGAEIEYVHHEGYPPLCIKGAELKGNEITLKGNVSSQYISALLMIGPALKDGLTLHLSGEIISRPYINLTLQLMQDFGAKAAWTSPNSISVAPQLYQSIPFKVESDWSAASYWYQIAALSPKAEIELLGLFHNSYQGDSRGAEVFSQPEVSGEFSVIKGSAPVAEMRGYQSQVISYTKGVGKLICTSDGYRECHNTEVVLEEYGYDPDRDLENTADSVFCSHGAGYNVKWNEVPDKLHIPPEDKRRQVSQPQTYARAEDFVRRAASDKELMEIFERTYGKIERDKYYAMRRPEKSVKSASKPKQIYSGVEYLLVDGYNIIFSWDELKKAANESLDLARSMLVNRLCNYQGYKQCELILVFDAYKVKEQERVVENYHNISIVYTKEAETADTYIERTAHKLSREHKVRVATSDGMEQVIIMGSGAFRMSAQELHEDVMRVEKEIREYIANMK